MQLLCDWPIWIGGKQLIKLRPTHTSNSAGVIASLHVLPIKCFRVTDEEVETTIW